MNANNKNTKNTEAKKQQKNRKSCKRYINPFSMDIVDDFYDPFEKDFLGFDFLENRMLRNFRNIFDFGYEEPKEEEKEEKEEEKPKEDEKPKEVKPVEDVKMEEEKEEPKVEEINTNTKEEPKVEEINTDTKMEEEKEENTNTKEEPKEVKEEKKEEKENNNNGTFYSKVYYSSYNNLNGKPNQESYQSQTIKQTNNGHDISETKEAYKNSNGVQKTAYQRDLDGKTTRFIKENNTKTGKKNQKKVIKGIEDNEIKDFNKEYDEYSKKCGFKKNFHNLDFDFFNPFGYNKKHHQLTDGNLLLHRLLF